MKQPEMSAAAAREEQLQSIGREGKYLVSLLRASLRGEPPMPVPNGLDWERLYRLSRRQLVAAAVWRALKKEEQCPPEAAARFRAAADGALRKELLFDGARAEIFEAFEARHIDYMPLKGVIIKDFYPAKGMREFADNDILYREKDRKAVDEVMRALGYKSEGLESVHDVYMKPPVYNFEMHRALFEGDVAFAGWFEQVWDRAILQEDGGHAWRMSDEDFYAYVIAHFAKHHENGGASLRSLADVYLMRQALSLDETKLQDIFRAIGLETFEHEVSGIAESLFGEEPRPVGEETMLYILSGGAYGTAETAFRNAVRKEGKLRVALRLAFPSFARMKTSYPVLKKLPVLLPVMWVVRLFTVLFGKKRKKATVAFKNFLKKDPTDGAGRTLAAPSPRDAADGAGENGREETEKNNRKEQDENQPENQPENQTQKGGE